MPKMVAFGDSITYGQCLPDCTIDKIYYGPNYSKFAWPTLVANKLGMKYTNISVPGASNDLILHNIINFEGLEKDDHVIILWTFIHRADIFENNGNRISISPNKISESKATGSVEWESFYKVHGDYDLFVRTVENIHHAMCHLNLKGVTVSNFSIDISHLLWKNKHTANTTSMSVDVRQIDLPTVMIDKASDDWHPGIESQARIADIIYNVHCTTHNLKGKL